jgi:diketogulonate reductase-like aldo/keto reductase
MSSISWIGPTLGPVQNKIRQDNLVNSYTMFDFKNVYETEQFGGQEIRQKLKYLSIIKSKNIFLSTKHCTRQKFIRYFKLYHVLFLFSQYLWLIYKSN